MNIVDRCICRGCGATRPEAPGPCPACADTRRIISASISCEVKMTPSLAKLGIKRGPQSWAYFYVILSVLLTFVGGIVGFLGGPGWAKAIVFGSLFIAVVIVILNDRRVHNLLLRFKSAYEDKVRY